MSLFLLLAASAVQPVAQPQTEAEIVVIARRAQMIQFSMKLARRDGRLVLRRCRVTRPSRNAEIDAVPCDAAQACMAENPATDRELIACANQHAQVRIDAIVDRLRAARAGRS